MRIDVWGTTTTTKPKATQGTGLQRPPRHYVALDASGKPADKALCGFVWDRLNVQHNGEICQECVDELRRRGLA